MSRYFKKKTRIAGTSLTYRRKAYVCNMVSDFALNSTVKANPYKKYSRKLFATYCSFDAQLTATLVSVVIIIEFSYIWLALTKLSNAHQPNVLCDRQQLQRICKLKKLSEEQHTCDAPLSNLHNKNTNGQCIHCNWQYLVVSGMYKGFWLNILIRTQTATK